MPFENIFKSLLADVEGSMGAMFLDYEGEAVNIVSPLFSRYDMQVIGAYEGIFLDQLRRICGDLTLGAPERFVITCADAVLLNWVLKDGYYVVLVLSRGAPQARAWHRLSTSRDQLMDEI